MFFILSILLSSFGSKAQLVPFLKDSKFGYSNLEGELTIKNKFDYASKFEKNDIAIVGIENKFWFINKKGQEIKKINKIENSENGFDEIKYYGYYKYKNGNRIGILNNELKLVYEEEILKSKNNYRRKGLSSIVWSTN